MRKKGFTLVEVLATIIILAIIAIIATPAVLGVIESARKGTLKNSALGLIESANVYYANEIIKGKDKSDNVTFDFVEGVQTSEKKLSYKGQLYNGKLILSKTSDIVMCIDDGTYYAYKEKDTDEVITGVGTCSYEDDKFIIQSDIEKCEKDCELAKKELQSQIEDLTDLVNKLKAIIDERDKTILDMQSTIDGLNNEIATLKIEKEILQDALNDANQNIDELMRRIAELEGQIASLNSTITGLQNQIKTLEGEKAELEELLSAKTEELQAINEQLGKVTATASDVLSGKTIYRKDQGLVTGTMNNYTNITKAMSGYETVTVQPHPSDSSQGLVTISNQYNLSGYIGTGTKIRTNIANLNAANIKAGVVVGQKNGSSSNSVVGTYTSDATATSGQILSGKTAYVKGSLVTGTIPTRSGSSQALKVSTGASGLYMVFPYGYYPAESHFNQSNSSEVYISNASVASAVSLTADKIKAGQTILGVTGTFTSDATASASQILSGKIAYVNGSKIEGTMPTLPKDSYYNETTWHTNATSIQYSASSYNDTTKYIYFGIPKNTYTGNTSWIRASESSLASNIGLTADKIKAGQTILGIKGTYTSDANATAGQILSGKIAYVNGTKITGNMTDYGREPQAKRIGQYNGSVYLYVPDVDSATNGVTSGEETGKITRAIKTPLSNFGNSEAANVLENKTFTSSAGLNTSGTMKNWTGTPQAIDAVRLNNNRFEVAVARGYHDYSWAGNSYEYLTYSQVANTIGLTSDKLISGQTVIGISGNSNNVNTSAGNLTSTSQILSGYSAYSDGKKYDGSMANKSGATVSATTVTESGTNALITIPTAGYYDTSSKISVPISTIKNQITSLSSGIYYLGTGSSFNVSSIDGYQNFTKDNFIVSVGSYSVTASSFWNWSEDSSITGSSHSISKSYNSSKGVFKVSGLSGTSYINRRGVSSQASSFKVGVGSVKVYLVVGDIKSL